MNIYENILLEYSQKYSDFYRKNGQQLTEKQIIDLCLCILVKIIDGVIKLKEKNLGYF